MDKEKVREVTEEELNEILPTQIKYMTFTNGEVRIVDNDDNKNQQYFTRKINENNINKDYIKELNEEYFEDNKNEINKNINSNFNRNNNYEIRNEEKEGDNEDENIRLYKKELNMEQNPDREKEIQTFQAINANNPRIQYQNEIYNEEQFGNNNVDSNKIIPEQNMNYNQILYKERLNNINSDKSKSPIKNNPENVVKEKSNYTLYSSNNCKSIKNTYIPKNYKGSDKTTFMEEKHIETVNNNYNNNSRQETELSQEIKANLLDQRFLASSNTKIVNAIPLDNYIENQIAQKKKSELLGPKIFVATNDNLENIITQKIDEQFEKIKKQNNNNMNELKYNIKNNNIQLENINANVIYPKQGYGNSENIQKKLKAKKKRRIYVRRKPIALQHFNVQIIQNPQVIENTEKPQLHEQPPIKYQNPIFIQSINSVPSVNKEYNTIKEVGPSIIRESKVPPVKSRNQNYNPNLIKVYPMQEEPQCKCVNHSRPQYYCPSTPQPYFYEKEKNYRYNVPFTPKQTIISLTPMRTMKEPPSPYQENIEIPLNNNKYFINERNRGFRPLTPPNPPHFERQYYDAENSNEGHYNGYERRRRKNNYLYPGRRVVEPMIVYEDDQMVEDDNNQRYRMVNIGNNY